jgi:siroheme synthase (precorrin-2 oxidase/ferrochelatase)
VNVADAPETGTFATMAAHRSGALVIGVSAGGVPGAAARIRDAIAERFDGRYARALGQLAELRRSLIDRRQGASWRALSSEVIDSRFCDEVEQERLAARVAPWR